MTNEQTISWIFLSVALASQTDPTDFAGISSIADGINHSIPTQKELQTSIGWLTSEGLVERRGKKFRLTNFGRHEYENASKDSKVLMTVWSNLEQKIAFFILTNEKKLSGSSVDHVLTIYKTRLKMQQDGITNPAQKFKDITKTIVNTLSKLPPDEKIIWDNHVMKDSKGNIIVEFPADT